MESSQQQKGIKIAIMMPIYNGWEFFEESLSSVILQTYNNWQLWIGVNGHPKGSDVYNKIYNTVKLFANEYDIVLLDFGEPGNKSSTLNKMVKMLSADIKYIALLDVDDIWYPNKLELQIPLLQMASPYHVVGGRCEYFGPDITESTIPNIPVGNFSRNFNFKSCNPIINSSVIIHTPLANWSEATILEDYDLWLKLRKRGDIKFYNCPQVLVKHRIHTDSAFNKNNSQHLNELLSKY
jgi:glycosyltransferase involved in cell wall biosynthesis